MPDVGSLWVAKKGFPVFPGGLLVNIRALPVGDTLLVVGHVDDSIVETITRFGLTRVYAQYINEKCVKA